MGALHESDRPPQADEQPKRKPLLSNSDLFAILDDEAEDIGVDDDTDDGKYAWNAMNAAANVVRDFYEGMLDRGELALVKTAPAVFDEVGSRCCGACGHIAEDYYGDPYRHCPGCGAKIADQ